MQEDKVEKNIIICKALSSVVKSLRGKRKISQIAYEADLPRSVILYAERGVKDPQLTTIFRISEGFNMRPSEFVKLIEDSLPKDWSITE